MKTKHNVCVKLTEKNCRKVLGILEMFGENVSAGLRELFTNHGLIRVNEHIGYEESAGVFYKYRDQPEHKTLIKPKELKLILAKEHLKEGDIIILKKDKVLYVAKFDRVSDLKKDFVVMKSLKMNCFFIGNMKYNKTFHHFDEFIRFATDEEKALLEPKPLKYPVTVTKEVWVNVYPGGVAYNVYSKETDASLSSGLKGKTVKGTLTYTLEND